MHRGNRKSEILLREIEYAATLASVSVKGYQYPKDQLDPLWEGGELRCVRWQVGIADVGFSPPQPVPRRPSRLGDRNGVPRRREGSLVHNARLGKILT